VADGVYPEDKVKKYTGLIYEESKRLDTTLEQALTLSLPKGRRRVEGGDGEGIRGNDAQLTESIVDALCTFCTNVPSFSVLLGGEKVIVCKKDHFVIQFAKNSLNEVWLWHLNDRHLCLICLPGLIQGKHRASISLLEKKP
jgi:hypothetical protein